MLSSIIWFNKRALIIWSQWRYTYRWCWLYKTKNCWETHQYSCLRVWFGRWALVMSFDRCAPVWMFRVHVCSPSRVWSSIRVEFNWCRCMEAVWLRGGSSQRMHLSGTCVFSPAVPHRQQDITLFLHDSNFSLLHVPRFIIIIIF